MRNRSQTTTGTPALRAAVTRTDDTTSDEIDPWPPGHDEDVDTKTARADPDHTWDHLSGGGQ